MENSPLISIGVPIYNDTPWLCNALDHLLNQDYSNLEIILADDGSTDGSREICREYARRDSRIRLFENKHNLGTMDNHKFVFDLSMGDYFAWGSGHDYYMPSFISMMLENLQANPSVVLCFPKSLYNFDGNLFKPPGLLDTRTLQPVERIKSLIAFRMAGGTADVFYGLYRSEFLEKVDIARDTVNTDAIMLAELSCLGEFMQIPDVLLYKVKTRDSNNVRATRESFREYLDKLKLSMGSVLKDFLPRFNSFLEYLHLIDSLDLPLDEKERLCEVIVNEMQRYAPAISEEIGNFIRWFEVEIPALKPHQLFERYQAAQILSVIEQVQMFGIEFEGLDKIRILCLTILNRKSTLSIKLPLVKETSGFLPKFTLASILRKVTNKLAGDNR